MIEIVFGKSACGTMKYIGIDPTDLYCFSFGLSMGDLAEKEYPDLSELKASRTWRVPPSLVQPKKSRGILRFSLADSRTAGNRKRRDFCRFLT